MGMVKVMAVTGKLTELQVRRARGPAVLLDGGGLRLRVAAPREGRDGKEVPGAKTWIYRFQLDGRRRDAGLGPYPDVPLAEARQRATELRNHRRDGIDPIEARRAKRAQARLDAAKAITFRECAEAYVAAHSVGWKNRKHAAQWPATLKTYVYPHFGAVAVQAVDVGLVLKALEPIWTVKPETAGRVRGRIEAVLDWAAARGYREDANPARWRGRLSKLLPPRGKVRRVEHHAALPLGELPAFIADLRGREGMAARALEFVVLTAARTGEVIGAKWGEISLADQLWVVPGERTKAGKEHRVPLSRAAVAVLQQVLPLALRTDGSVDPDAPVFPGPRRAFGLSNMALLALLQRRMGRNTATTHGFRADFRSWCAERGFAREIAEMALGHAVGDRTELSYQRSDVLAKRRRVMDAWARFLASLPVSGTVVRPQAAR